MVAASRLQIPVMESAEARVCSWASVSPTKYGTGTPTYTHTSTISYDTSTPLSEFQPAPAIPGLDSTGTLPSHGLLNAANPRMFAVKHDPLSGLCAVLERFFGLWSSGIEGCDCAKILIDNARNSILPPKQWQGSIV